MTSIIHYSTRWITPCVCALLRSFLDNKMRESKKKVVVRSSVDRTFPLPHFSPFWRMFESLVGYDMYQQIALIQIYQTVYYICAFKLIFQHFPSITSRMEKSRSWCWDISVFWCVAVGKFLPDTHEAMKNKMRHSNFLKLTFNFFLQIVQRKYDSLIYICVSFFIAVY